VLPSAQSFAWLIPFAVEPMHSIDFNPYRIQPSVNTNNDVYAFGFGVNSALAFATLGCNGNNSDCDLAINTDQPIGDSISNPGVYDRQTILAHEFGHWGGASHSGTNALHRFSQSALGAHPSTMRPALTPGIWNERFFNVDDVQNLYSARFSSSVGIAADRGFDNGTFPGAWGNYDSSGGTHSLVCGGFPTADSGNCAYSMRNTTGWTSVNQDFWNHGAGSQSSLGLCFRARSVTGTGSVVVAVWNIDSNTNVSGQHFFSDTSWRSICTPTKLSGANGHWVRAEVYPIGSQTYVVDTVRVA
jgi:hypothetical protein